MLLAAGKSGSHVGEKIRVLIRMKKAKKEKMIYNEPTNKGKDPTIREGESVGFCPMLVGY